MSAAPRNSSYEAVVIGGGIVGLACAWRAAQRGISVLVVERDRPAAGASGVAAGMLAPVTEAEFGEEKLLRLNLAAAARWPSFAAELAELSGLPTGYRRCGAVVVAADRDDVEELRRLHRFQRSLGLDAAWLSGRECRRLEPALSPRVAGGVLAPHDHQADPAAVTAALAAAARSAGAHVLEGTTASVTLEGDRVTGVRLEDGGVVGSETVVLAAGAWSRGLGGLPEDALPPVRPVKGQILQLRARTQAGSQESLVRRIVRTPRCYVVDRGDGRVVVGATVEERGFDTAITADGVYRLLEAAWEVLPDVGELELVGALASLRPGSPDNGPLVGWGAVDGLLVATGHHRNGVLLAPITGDAVAALLDAADPPEELGAFDPRRFAAHLERHP
jgi:glycine oxidase